MLRRTLLQSLAASALAPLLPAAKRPPNLVFFLSDDMGYGDLGCYGSRTIRTPHIDSLARDGVRFTGCYANGPVCTPTRTAFLTGRYQQRFGRDLEWALSPPNNKTAGLSPADSVLPAALKRAGYRSGIFGKWHVGWNPEYRPLRHGFDESFGILLGNADMYSHEYHDGSNDLWENDQPIEEDGYLTEMIAERAARFVDRNAANPFFLYVPFNAVHWPFQEPGRPDTVRNSETWRDGLRSEYVGMTESMDEAVGRVLAALKRNGLEENTLVIFTNDNGGERLSDSGPLFHVKGALFEGGIRVPALARWPGRIPGGTTTRQVCATMDFTASLLSAAGAQPPDGVQLDGRDLLPVITGQRDPFERTLCWRIDNPGRRQLAARRGKWKYINESGDGRGFPELLHDVEAEPSERRNLFYDNQDIARELRQTLLAWEREVEPR